MQGIANPADEVSELGCEIELPGCLAVTDSLKQAVSCAFPLEDPITVVRVAISNRDLIGFIKSQPFTVKGFWSPPYCQQIVWMGFILARGKLSKDFIEALPDGGRIYGGMRFCPEGEISSEWEPFGKAVFIVPRFEIRGGEELLCYLKKEDTLEKVFEEVDRINWSYSPPFSPDKTKVKAALFTDWADQIRQVKESSFEKLVLAKRFEVEADEDFCAWSVLREIKREESFSWAFAIDGATFVGASPERLFSREGNQIFSEAIAGTRARSSAPLLDAALRKELLDSEKDVYEHALVTKYIESELNKLCKEVHVGALSTLLGSDVQHLIRRFSGVLRSEVSDSDVIEALHPTPAVGGLPKEGACEKIYEIEHFDRGWYAGIIGWAQNQSSEFAVGIRSCLIFGKKLYWYSGCGIVDKSDAWQEWEEAELKAKPFIGAL